MTGPPTLSHYKILERLGSGGMGVVYRAEDLILKRRVALKFLLDELAAREDLRIRFLREARTAAALNHPNICTIHEVGEVEPGVSVRLEPEGTVLPPGTPFLAMELVEGRTLQAILSGSGPLPLKNLLEIAGQVAEGLAEAHAHKIVHRDLKPGNVMVTPQGRVKILDFGLAKALELPQSADAVMNAAQTISDQRSREGKVVGTIAYMSPEQARGQALDSRSDTFSFGIMLYEMVTGKSPFPGSTPMDTLSSIIQKHEIPVRELNPEAPPRLADVVERCLEKDPGERYQDSRDLVVDLKHLTRDVVSGVSSPAVPVPMKKPLWRRPAVLAGMAVMAVSGVLLVLAAFLLFREGRAPVVEAQANSLAVLAFENLKDPADPERLGQILQELIITDLSGLESLKVFSSQRLFDVYKQLAGKDQRTMNREIATQVAARAGAGTMLTGSLSQLGSKWIMTGQLVDVAKGTVLKSARIDGTDLYSMVDQLTAQIRGDFHVPVPARGTADPAVGEKTTPSMEAYRHYLTGADLLNAARYKPAAEEFRKAISIDPAFSQAYYKLAIARWWNSDDLGLAQKPLSDLLSGKLRTSSKERLMAEGALSLISLCWRKSLPSFERLVRDYPDEKEAWYGLGEALYHGGGDHTRAREAFESAMKLDPSFTLSLQHILDIHVQQQKQQEFFKEIKSKIEKDPQNPVLYRYWVLSAIATGEETEARAAMAEAQKHHVSQDEKRQLYKSAGMAYFAYGRSDVTKVEELLQKALDADPKRQDAEILGMLGGVRWQRGDYAGAERRLLEALEADPGNTNTLGSVYFLFAQDRRFKEFIARVKSAIRVDPDNPALYRHWVMAAIAEGDEAETEQAMAEALKRHTGGDALRLLYTMVARGHQEGWHPEKAEEFGRKALAAVSECETADLLDLLGWTCRTLGKEAEAEGWFLKALDLEPNNAGHLYGLFWSTAGQRKYGEFLLTAKRWIQVQPGSPGAYLLSAEAAVYMGEEGPIETAMAEALKHYTDPGSKKQLFSEVAYRYLDLSQVERAGEFARKTLEAAPDQPDESLYILLGRAALALKNYSEAEEWFRKGLALRATGEDALRSLSDTHLERKEYGKAIEVAKRLVQVKPASPWNHAKLLEAHVRAGLFPDAERLLESSLSATSSPSVKRTLLTQAGWSYFHAGRYEAARAALERAVRLDPEGSNVDPYEGLGRLALRQGRHDEAERAFLKGLAALPRHDGILRGLATLKLLGRDFGAAEKQVRDQLAQGPAHLASYQLLGYILAEQGRFGEAEKYARKAVSMNANRASLNLLAWVLVAGELDIQRGVETARQALKTPADYADASETYPFTPVAEHTLGLAALKKGSIGEAVKFLEAAARLRPDRRSIREDLEHARARLK